MTKTPSSDEVLMRLATNIRRNRHAAGLTQKELAQRTELNEATISALERGLHGPKAGTIYRLCGGMNIRVSALFEGIRWIPDPQGGRYEVTDDRADDGRGRR